MARFKLLAGQHIQADKSKPVNGPDGKPTGRFASKTFTTGQVVESDLDLAALHGPQKFELVGGEVAAAQDKLRAQEKEIERLKAELLKAQTGETFRTPGDPSPDSIKNDPATFPHGQVSTGFQGGAPEEEGDGEDADDDLAGLKVADLKQLAADEEVDLQGATHKAEIQDRIRAHRKGK
jgi:hypothetical protein